MSQAFFAARPLPHSNEPPNKGLQLAAYTVARLGVYPHDTTSGVHQPAVTSPQLNPWSVGRRGHLLGMNWDALGAVAELAGAIGVIASLLYVATQVRYSNRASAVEAKLATTRFMTDFADVMLENPGLNEVMLRGQSDLGSLSAEEFWQFNHLATKAFWFFSAGYFQVRRHTLPEDDWHELRAVAHFWLGTKGCRDWWRRVGRPLFGGEFAMFIDGEIAAIAAQQGAAADGQQHVPTEVR